MTKRERLSSNCIMDYSGLEAAAGNLLRVILGVKVGAQVAPASPTARQVATVQKQR